MTYEIKCYKIWWEDNPDEFYIGSTKHDALSKRMGQHRSNARACGTSKIYQTMREKGYDFQYIQLASCMVSNRDEQLAFEQQYIDQLKPTLNTQRAHGFDIDRYQQYNREYSQKPEVKQYRKEYRHKPEVKHYNKEYRQRPEVKQRMREYYQKPENKQRRKQYHKEYRQKPENKQRIKQKKKEYLQSKKRTCICGSVYVDISYWANIHYNSKKHIDWVKDFYERLRSR